MKCPLCKNDMQIASSFLKNIEADDGKNGIFSVVDLMCTDLQCPNGKKKTPVIRESRAIENRAEVQNAVSCCGEPIVYFGDDGAHWIPDGVEAKVSADGRNISALCSECGKKHTIELNPKEQIKE